MNNTEASHGISIRPYKSADADATLRIFQGAIMVTAAADYTPEQLRAWARPGLRVISEWDQSMRRRNSYVALIDEQLAGFGDVSEDGYIDMLFVSPRFARQGVGRALLTFLERQARSSTAKLLTANVSITARAFFESCGFRIESEQHPLIDGVVMTNFRMAKELKAQ